MEEQKRHTDRFLRSEKIEKHKKKSKLLDLANPFKLIFCFELLGHAIVFHQLWKNDVHPALGSGFNLRTMLIERFGQYHIGESDRVCQSQILLSHTPPFSETDIRFFQLDVGYIVVSAFDKIEFHNVFLLENIF